MLSGVIGEDAAIRAMREKAARVLGAERLPPILIEGETGSGKTLLARELHAASARAGAPFVSVNCAAIPEQLLESELFGVERGAFTDARDPKPGLLHAAHRGALFLDEVGYLPPRLQPKLLTVIEEWKVRRLGATRAEPVDVWLIAATSEELERAIGEGRFLRALYHRLAVMTLRVALATNPVFPRAMIDVRACWAGLDLGRFALVTSADEMRWCKPRPEYYREIAARLDVDPRACLMVGNDVAMDLAPAARAGMRTCALRNAYLVPGGDGFVPDHACALAEVPALLAA
jgi:FMN phosphatase YigB (HAD superfamily)